ncbi:cold-shock protein [Algicola sagamiensis]|uniref:cold-shock protein n=1 Tax=Algicola sagamiensis TaxID=163869 RepID=UPI0003607421|nr:cold shock domain-containing protein [Algicola sagamiensis]
MSEKLTGKIKFFNAVKGFGFIEMEDGTNVFVHHEDIVMDGYRNLHKNQIVKFELIDQGKGPKAQNVDPLYQFAN